MKVTGNGVEVLTERASDDWSSTYRAGAEVFRGYFLTGETADSEDRLCKLDTSKKSYSLRSNRKIDLPDVQMETTLNETFTKYTMIPPWKYKP